MSALPGTRRMLINTGSAWVFKIASMLSSLITTAIAVREYGLHDMGLILLASQVATYAGLIELGIPSSLSRRLPGLLADRNDTLAFSLCASCFSILLVTGLLLLIVTLPSALSLPDAFAISDDQKRVAGTMFAITIASTALQMPLRIGYGILSSTHRFSTYFKIEFVALIVKTTMIVGVLLAFNPPAWIYVLLSVLPQLAAAVMEYRAGRAVLPQWRFSFSQISWRSIRELLSLSLAVMLGTLAAALTTNGGGVIIGTFASTSVVAEYSLPAVLAFNLMAFAASSSAFLSPIASQLVGRDNARLAQTVKLTARYSLAVAGALFISVSALGQFLLWIWLGHSVSEQAIGNMYWILLIAMLSGVLSIPGSTTRGALVAMGWHWQVAFVELGTSVAGVIIGVLAALFLDFSAPLAVACAFCLASFLRGILLAEMFGMTAHSVRLQYIATVSPVVVPILIGTGIVVAGLIASRGSTVGAFATAASAGVGFAIATWFFVIEELHRHAIRAYGNTLLKFARKQS